MIQDFSEQSKSLMSQLKVDSLAGMDDLSFEELCEQLGDMVDIGEARQLHEQVRRARNQTLLDEKSIIIRHSPLVPKRLQDVNDGPIERPGRYCAPGDVASMFSPAAYLADPDAVAQNDPMHYKYNVFMRLLDICIGRGDAAYRKLQRDTLSEASVWYQRAVSLLGDAPWAPPATGWNEPVLGQAAVPGESPFLPEVNRTLLGYWEALRIRQYNLRHNLTLDGQPLSLPLYATPADPKALLAAAVAAEASGERGLTEVSDVPALRFAP